jgi:ABC-type phosphate transport system substrate-binding protein
MILLVEFLARGPTIATGTSGASTGTSVTYINGTGGTFPFSVYKELIFSYHFVASDTSVSYLADGSGTGKCNIMGFWHTGNIEASSIPSSIKVADQALCTASSRPSRQPLVDFSGSDSVLSEADYSNFPDLQMLPSVAGAVVPIYNIPEIANGGTKSGLALSRSTLAGIFKGTIRYWGDANIIKDVNQSSRSLAVALKRLSKVPINVVVRQDSSGTSEIFSNALASFDPKGVSSPDFSFGALGSAGSTPSWCDPKTDEIQDITFSGCNTTSVGSNEVVDGGGVAYFKIVKPSGGGFADVYIQCNDTIQSLSYRFGNSSIRVFPVSRTVVSEASLNIDGSLSSSSALDGMYSVTFRIAYPYSGLSKTNWYQPAVVTTSEGLSVSIATVQEGGYLNAPYSGTKKTTALTQSVWVLSNYSTTVSAAAMNNASWITFRLSWSSSPVFGSNGVAESSSSHNQSAVINTTSPLTDISSVMKTAITAAHPGAVSSVSRASFKHGWAEYQIVFSSAAGASGIFSSMTANITDASADVQLSGRSAFSKVVHVTKLLDANRYPQFYDSSHPRGYSGSGR